MMLTSCVINELLTEVGPVYEREQYEKSGSLSSSSSGGGMATVILKRQTPSLLPSDHFKFYAPAKPTTLIYIFLQPIHTAPAFRVLL